MAWGTQDTRGTTDVAAAAERRGSEGEAPLSVSAAVGLAKARVAQIATISVTGEVTGFRGPNARSGHCYFEVKDDAAVMSVIVWRGVYQASGVELRDGMQLELRGSFDVYPGNGRLSFVAKRLTVAGEGLLRQQVAQLARRLEAEGLMAAERKRPIPRFCTRVAVVTSLSGAVVEDVRRTLRRRNPLVELLLVGCTVQGPGAPASIMAALGRAAAARPDVVLLVRGGGSFEDLMAFNDEALARAVAALPVPVVCGVGHESDTCICDMVADRRASTPTAAAEGVAPALDEIVASIDDREARLGRAGSAAVERARQGVEHSASLMGRSLAARLDRERLRLDALASHRCLASPASLISDRTASLMLAEQRLVDALPRDLALRRDVLERAAERLAAGSARLLAPFEAQMSRLAASLDALSPLRVLARGYAIARTPEGRVITDAAALRVGDELRVRVARGSFEAAVTAAVGEGGQAAAREQPGGRR